MLIYNIHKSVVESSRISEAGTGRAAGAVLLDLS